MAPNTDQTRWSETELLRSNENQASEVELRHCSSLSMLKSHEVCIDGIIYDLSDFDHPGGGSIRIFGGNDVTIQYRMIHPYHTKNHLLKMKAVGKVLDYQCEYKFDTPFEIELKERVFKIVPRGTEFATPGWYFRALGYLGLYFYLAYLWGSQGSSWWLAAAMGVSHASIGLNVQHDANHGACSKRHVWINELFGFGADLIGGSKWLWEEQHWTHHAYTNHEKRDPDGFAAEPMLLFNDYAPSSPRRHWYHRFQAVWFFPVLAGYWLSAMLGLDVYDLKHRGALATGLVMESEFLRRRRMVSILHRTLYVLLYVVTPFWHHGFCWTSIGHILLFGAVGSLSLGILFGLSHNFEGVERHPTMVDGSDKGPVCWWKAQVETSSTYGGFLAGYFTGGLNFQVEHHLFPRMNSSWYPYIAPTVREVCRKHGVRYAYFPWVWQNLVSTLKYMHAAGNPSHPIKAKHA